MTGTDVNPNWRFAGAECAQRCKLDRSACGLVERQERGVASRGGGVDRHRPLGGKAMEVAWPAGLRPGAAQAFAAERLHPDDGADHVAVDIAVADPEPP